MNNGIESLVLIVNNLPDTKLKKVYPNIDMEKTGLLLKDKLDSVGYTPKMIQEFLQLSCPQPIYRWYKGKILPSVDHLLMLSELLGVHMEELLVKKKEKKCVFMIDYDMLCCGSERLKTYYNKVRRIVA